MNAQQQAQGTAGGRRGWPRAAAHRLTRWELPLLLPLFLAGAVAPRALPALLAAASLFWPLRWLAHGRLTVRTAADWPSGLLLLTLPVTLWATALPDVTRPQVLQVLAGMALYYAIVNWVGQNGILPDTRWVGQNGILPTIRWLASGLVAVGLGLALVAPVAVRWFAAGKLLFIPASLYRGLPLLLPDPIHPNVLAGALDLLLPLALALPLFAWRDLRWYERALTVTGTLAMAGVLVLTKSRGGLMALGAVLVVLIALRWRRGWLAAPVMALAGAAAVWRIGLGPTIEALTVTQALGGLDGRLEVWSRARFMIEDFPFTGSGMGTFRQVANAMYPFFLAGPDAGISHAHNLFLQVAVDLGLPGLAAWLALFALICWSAWRVYRRGRGCDRRVSPPFPLSPSPYLAGLGAGLLASQVALAVHGLTDAVTWGTRPALIVWAVWGLTMAAWNQLRTQPAAPES